MADILTTLKNIKETLQTTISFLSFEDGELKEPAPSPYTISDPIETLLDNGIVEFWYWELDGKLRFAVGTRNEEIINEYITWSWRGPQPSPMVCAYFDIQRNEWRCFRRDKFIKTMEFTDKKDLYQ